MDAITDAFGKPLQLDPTIALQPFPLQPIKTGLRPMRKLEYVVEIVGPRTIPAGSAKAVLHPDWQAALGNPRIYVMAQSDTDWRPMIDSDTSTSYDSLCFSWSLFSQHGQITSGSAQKLLTTCESFANQLSRRAIPLTPPQDIDPLITDLRRSADQFDIGVGLSLIPPAGAIRESDVWTISAALGLDLDPTGYFVWRITGWEEPLFSLCSLGNVETFSLQAVKAGVSHPALSIGFGVPRCPNPVKTFDACLSVATVFQARTGLVIQDDEGRIVDSTIASEIRSSLLDAENALRRVGYAPGSPESLRLFPAT
jgi:hypothetical protein